MESKNITTANEEGRSIQTLKAHLALNVSNVDQSIEFYRKMFGIEPSKVRTGYAKFDVQQPPLNFTLNQGLVKGHGALSHLGIQVASTDDVLAMRRRWNDAGLTTRDEMQTSCCYAVQDKAWVRDPDDNQWEVFVVLEDNLPESNLVGSTASTESGNGACAIDAATDQSQPATTCCAPPSDPVRIAR